jgi:hypothetical protein
MVTLLAPDTCPTLTHRHRSRAHCPALKHITASPNTLVRLLYRYPYLYKNTIAQQDPIAVERFQQHMQTKFEIQLSRYVAAQSSRSDQIIAPNSVSNPTLLSHYGVSTALHHFTDRVQGTATQKDLAHRLLAETPQWTFRTFKQNLYSYLIAAIPADQRVQKFNQKLRQRLDHFMPDNHNQPFNRFLLTATCRDLFKFLTVANAKNLNHHVLIDTVSQLSPFFVAELLLRILLLCPQSRVHLDKRLAIVFIHYANAEQHETNWLIQLLEYLNIAYCTNLGSVVIPRARAAA